MADPIIEEMRREVLDYRKYHQTSHVLRRWAQHLQDVVQPQLDELAQLKASASTKKGA